jgi:hypothetical protein
MVERVDFLTENVREYKSLKDERPSGASLATHRTTCKFRHCSVLYTERAEDILPEVSEILQRGLLLHAYCGNS